MITLHPDSLVNLWQLSTAALIGAVLTILFWPLGIVWALMTGWRQLARRRRIRTARCRTRALFDAPAPVRVDPSLDVLIAERDAKFRA